jgi:hypothetical protein
LIHSITRLWPFFENQSLKSPLTLTLSLKGRGEKLC